MAKDFGVKGHLFQIEEQPFLQMINERLQKVDMEKEKKKMQAITKDRVENPRAVEGISNSDEDRSFYWDPTIVVEKDIILPCGKLLHKAGTKLNPLDHENFDRRLFIIDAREQRQVDWLKIKLKENIEAEKFKIFEEVGRSKQTEMRKIEDRIILVGGKPFDLQEELKEEGIDMTVYFDQIGEITNRFGIKYTPALAYQEKDKIRIDQFHLGEK
jgi:conjugal transfer pilus assembly protein TraW